MTPSSNLFDIIHSLTASEKRYFKVFSSTHVIGNKNNYVKLFDAYCELPGDQPYDEAGFKKKLTTKKWAKNFAVEKKFLEDMLMKAMRAYNAEKSSEGALNDIISNIHFLYNKGLISAATKELNKGITMANEMENLPSLIILYQLKLNLTRITHSLSDIEIAEADLAEETRILTLLDNERKVVHARRKIYNLYRSNLLKKNLEEIKKTISELELMEQKQTLTFKARVSIFFMRAMVAEKENRFEDAMREYEQANAMWKKNELKLHESYSTLRIILTNYLACAHRAARYDVYPATIKQIESLPIESSGHLVDTFVATKCILIVYLLNTDKREGAEELIDEVEEGLKKYKDQIVGDQFIHIHTNICFLLFRIRKYEKLIDALNRTFVLIGREEKLHQLTYFLKLFEIMAQFSLKNYDVIDYQIRNMERWMKEHKLGEKFTDIFLKSLPDMRLEQNYNTIKNQLATIECSAGFNGFKEMIFEWIDANQPNPKTKAKGLASASQLARRSQQ